MQELPLCHVIIHRGNWKSFGERRGGEAQGYRVKKEGLKVKENLKGRTAVVIKDS